MNERGAIGILVELLLVLALGYAIYEFWIKERIAPLPPPAQIQTPMDAVKEKVNDAFSKELSRVPASGESH
jgi:hypothetical protein